MMEPSSTRDRLLDAAAHLFAEKGIANVSIAEIVREAGQKNVSAVHYYFGNRDEVLREVLGRHVPAIADRRIELLEIARMHSASEPRSAVEAIVRPLTEFAQRGWRERCYLQIGSELTGSLSEAAPAIRALMAETAGYEAWDEFRDRCAGIPDDLWKVRREICIVFIGRAAADRARQLDRGDGASVLSDDRFVNNLIDMVIGAMSASNALD